MSELDKRRELIETGIEKYGNYSYANSILAVLINAVLLLQETIEPAAARIIKAIDNDSLPTYDGSECPECGKAKLDYGNHEFTVDRCWLEVLCLSCRAEWKEEFKLHDYEITKNQTGVDLEKDS